MTSFDQAAEYDAMLAQGIQLSGEEKGFFIDGRLADLRCQLPPEFAPHRILDFGCGIGDTSAALGRLFPAAEVVGVDAADAALESARRTHGSPQVTFRQVRSLAAADRFDLCYINGVFHHIEPDERPAVLGTIRRALRDGALIALFENNPWNPGTRLVMKRIPFDRDAQPFNVVEARRLLRTAGFRIRGVGRFLFYFPRPLRALRAVEPWLVRLPLGAQYWVMGEK